MGSSSSFRSGVAPWDTSSTTKTITCEDGTSVVVQNGTPGTPGDAGISGQDGENGTSCSVTDNGDSTKTVGCRDGTSVLVRDGAQFNQFGSWAGTSGISPSATSPCSAPPTRSAPTRAPI